jgi:hypothetical protein
MAQRVVLIDDLDGSEGSETLLYTVDGQEYEIDLSEENANTFRTTWQTYIQKSRPVERQVTTPTGRPTTRRRSSGSGREDIAEIRAWAEAKGIQVSPRGRIKREIIDQYDAAHTRAHP